MAFGKDKFEVHSFKLTCNISWQYKNGSLASTVQNFKYHDFNTLDP